MNHSAALLSIGIYLAAIILSFWCLSQAFWFEYEGSRWSVRLEGGAVYGERWVSRYTAYGQVPPTPKGLWCAKRDGWPFGTIWGPHTVVPPHFTLQLWIPLVICLVPCSLEFARSFNSRSSPGCCETCGYDLTGNVSGVCPECGRPTGDAAVQAQQASAAALNQKNDSR
jgi:hypothetical protein